MPWITTIAIPVSTTTADVASDRSLSVIITRGARALRISATLHQNLEDETILIDGAPEPVLLAADRNDDS